MPRPDEPKAKLGWVLDGQFYSVPAGGPARGLADGLADAVRELGRLERIDEATAATASLLGEAIDADPTNAALWSQFRAALGELRAVGASGDDDGFAQLIAGLSADVRDPAEPQQGNKGDTDRKGERRTRPPILAAPATDSGRGRGASP